MSARLLVVAAAAALLAGCGAASSAPKGTGTVDPGNWPAVLAQAHGQTVRWWMYGGDTRVNRYVDEMVRPAAAKLGVNLQRVPVTDTADAVQRVVAEQRAGRRGGGSVDLIWINGANFAQGAGAGLWLRDWAPRLPNARYVDWSDPTIANDFGVPVVEPRAARPRLRLAAPAAPAGLLPGAADLRQSQPRSAHLSGSPRLHRVRIRAAGGAGVG